MSATPMRAQTVLISGKLSKSRRSTSFSLLIVSERELPGLRNVCIAISPSSSSGINSPPIRVKAITVIPNMIIAERMTAVLCRSEKRISGLYAPVIFVINLLLACSNLFSNLTILLSELCKGRRIRAEIIGT